MKPVCFPLSYLQRTESFSVILLYAMEAECWVAVFMWYKNIARILTVHVRIIHLFHDKGACFVLLFVKLGQQFETYSTMCLLEVEIIHQFVLALVFVDLSVLQ
jgi:hypothetical protein